MYKYNFIELIIYVLLFIFFLNLFFAFIQLYKDIRNNSKKKDILKNFFSNLIFGSIKVMDLYNFFF